MRASSLCRRPHCETTLSNFEVAQGYRDIKDISVYVKFKMQNAKGKSKDEDGEDRENTYFLAWTTTPWTLPGNVALAVGKDIEYVKVKVESRKSKSSKVEEQSMKAGMNLIGGR